MKRLLQSFIRHVLLIAVVFMARTGIGLAQDQDLGRGTMVRKVFLELLDATDPHLSTAEKKHKIIETMVHHRDIIKELFFIKNRDVWEAANFHINYDKVKDQIQFGPFTSLLFHKKEEIDLNHHLENFNNATFNIIPNISKAVIQHFPLPPMPMAIGFSYIPGIKEMTDHEVEQLANGINQYIIKLRITDSHLMEELFSPPKGFDLTQMPEESRGRYVESVQNFVNNFPLDRKRHMAHALLSLPPDASLGKMVAAASVHSGPLFVKLLQLMQNYAPKEMQTELKVLLDGLPPHLSEDEVKDIMDKTVPESVKKRIIKFNLRPLSVASLGQVHSMVLELPSGKIVKTVVKLLAPKLKKMTEVDLVNLREAMSGFKMGDKMVASMEKVMSEELDLESEAEFTRIGAEIYRDPKEGIDVVEILQGKDFPLTKELEVQTFAKGKPLSKTNEESIKEMGVSEAEFYTYLSKSLISYMKKWFKHVIFEETLFGHADSHKGNAFFNIEKNNPPNEAPYRLTIIDFGSACRMSKDEAKAVIEIGQGLVLCQPSDIVNGLKKLSLISNNGEEVPAEMEKLEKLRNFIEDSRKDYVSMHDWFNKIASEAMRLEIDFPVSFLQFNRGRVFIENLIEESLAKLKNSPDPQAQEAYGKLQNAFDIYMVSALTSFLKDIFNKVTTGGSKHSVTSIPTMAMGSIKKSATVIGACLQHGPVTTFQQEVRPILTNLYHVTRALAKDYMGPENPKTP